MAGAYQGGALGACAPLGGGARIGSLIYEMILHDVGKNKKCDIKMQLNSPFFLCFLKQNSARKTLTILWRFAQINITSVKKYFVRP